MADWTDAVRNKKFVCTGAHLDSLKVRGFFFDELDFIKSVVQIEYGPVWQIPIINRLNFFFVLQYY